VLAQYNSVNSNAAKVASTPFQQYSTDPNAFVAPLNSTEQSGIANTNAASGQAQPYYQQATGTLNNAQGSASNYYSGATDALGNAQNTGQGLAAASLGSLNGAQGAANDLNAQGYNSYQNAYNQAQPYTQTAANDTSTAQNIGAGLGAASLGTLQGATNSASPLQSQAAQGLSSAYNQAQPYNQAATGQYYAGLGAAQPLNNAANQNISSAQQTANPYQSIATGLGLAGAQAVNATPLGTAQINQYMSPYLQDVVGSESQLLNQNNQQAMAGQLGNAISSGAFGGDRAGIAAANLSQQQNLANSQIYSNLLNTGYNNALGAAQQQQGVNLSAGQANRAALSNASSQLLGIGNQGFNQGITAAQTQANLGNQEFNQASTTGQNLQNVGQQAYAQGTGTAQAQAGLGNQLYNQGANTAAQQATVGNELNAQGMAAGAQQAALGQQQYSQGMGLGSAQTTLGQNVYNQGANTAAQQAALGQQQFAQGNTTSQSLAGLGQDVYNTGAATSQGLSNLGTASQSAALQGAQAQLAAGQTAQQTQQAGDTALYNQFLQQQSYPFQTAQFLANIAEGTGSLSGSTTTTNQPGSLFSDERLKEDKRIVGKTFDGQPIYSYKYKGDPHTQMGLMAQEVETKHPHAVGLAAGFKTVDYKKATDKAAQRGRFAQGGLTGGFDPQLMQEILQNAQGMYGNTKGAASGLGGPYGGVSVVPAANVPVSQLHAPEAPKDNRPSTLQNIDNAVKIGDYANQGLNFAKNFLPDQNYNITSTNDGGFTPSHNGGARGYDNGGAIPYAGAGLNIPDQTPDVHSLQPPQPNGSKPSSTGSGIMEALKLAGTLASLSGGLKNGGAVRKGYADGGDPTDPSFIDSLINGAPDYVAGLAPVATGVAQLGQKLGQTAQGTGDKIRGLAGAVGDIGGDVLNYMSGNKASATSPTAAPAVETPPVTTQAPSQSASPVAVAVPRHKKSSRSPGLTPDQNYNVETPSDGGYTPTPQAAPVQGLGAAYQDPSLTQNAPTVPGMTPQSGLSAIASNIGDATNNAVSGLGGFVGNIGKGIGNAVNETGDYVGKHQQTIIPLLSALAAASAAPTRNSLTALLQGAGAYGQSYKDIQNQQAALKQTQATTQGINATTASNIAKAAGINGVVGVQDPNSKFKVGETPYSFETVPLTGQSPSASPVAPTAPVAQPQYHYLGKAAQALLGSANSDYVTADDNTKANALAEQQDIAKKANDARSGVSDLNQYAEALETNATGDKFLSSGAYQPIKTMLVAKWNSAFPQFAIDPTGLEAAQIVDKMNAQLAGMKAKGLDQRSAQALTTEMNSTANNTLSPAAGLTLAAGYLTSNQKDMDMANQQQELQSAITSKGGKGNWYLPGQAINAFNQDNDPVMYQKEKASLIQMLKSGAYAKINNVMQGNDPVAKQQLLDKIKQREAQGLYTPNFHRYFTGGS